MEGRGFVANRHNGGIVTRGQGNYVLALSGCTAPTSSALYQGVPRMGSSQRSTPHQPATFHASISKIAMVKSSAFVLAAPAMMKFQFMKPPKKAAMPVKTPRIS